MRALVLLAGIAAPSAASGMQPQQGPPTPVDALAQELEWKVEQSPGSPASVLHMAEMAALWDLATPGVVEQLLVRLSKEKGLAPQSSIYLGDLAREKLYHDGRFGEAAEAARDAGLVTDWLVVGPFDNEDRGGPVKVLEPEEDAGAAMDRDLVFQGDERSVGWRTAEARPLDGLLDLGNWLQPSTKVCGFAATYVELAKASTVSVWAAAGGTLKVWIDGAVAIDDPVYRAAGRDRSAAGAKLSKGTHVVLAKVCVDDGPWTLQARLTDKKGKGIPGAATIEPSKVPAGLVLPKILPVPHAFGLLAAGLEADPDDPEALSAMARFMHLTHSDDLTETVAPDHAQKAADASGACADLVLLARVTDDRDQGIEALKRCLLSEPGNAEASYLYALSMRDRMGIADFRNMVKDLEGRFPDDLRIRILGAQVVEEAGMPMTAFGALVALEKRFGPVPALLRAEETLAEQAQGAYHASFARQRILEVRADDDVRRTVAARAGDLGLDASAVAEIGVVISMDPKSVEILGWAAGEHMAMGDPDQAGQYLLARTAIAPHSPGAWQDLGRHLLMTGKRDEALACYQTVLELEPSNYEVREYIAHLYPREKFEKGYVVTKDEILSISSSKGPDAGFEMTTVVDQRVDRVYGNGMSASFVQRAIRANTEQGAKKLRYIPVEYSPSLAELDILSARVIRGDGSTEDMTGSWDFPVFDPGVRMYYDEIQTVMEMPPVLPGDVVEVSYKISDVAPRNMFDRNFSALVPVLTTMPCLRFRYGLVAPSDLDVRVVIPGGVGLAERAPAGEPGVEGEVAGGVQARIWEAGDLEAIQEEPDMPPLAEVVPLIKVSTFDAWEDFGSWWWGLSSQQMVADKTIKDKVAELTSGLDTDSAKVAAIFDWVIRSTRYIALEFGVHGYKPYPSPLVVARGFGDCKDKATLLHVMIREAGIESGVALVRTRMSGDIGSTFPGPFQFDHAIAYVPSLGLFLDGTVDYLGTSTLPWADQDVFALVVVDGKTLEARTPRPPPSTNAQDSRMVFSLQPDGDATVEGSLRISGSSKGYYRSTYQTEATRAQRLESELSSVFAGLDLGEFEMGGLDEYDDDVTMDFEAAIPNYALAGDGSLQFAALPSHGLFKSMAPLSTRKFDVVIGAPRVWIDGYTYEAPPGMAFTDAPLPVQLGKEGDPWWFRLESALISPTRLEVVATLVFDAFRVTPDEYPSFREFCGKVDDAMGQRARIGEAKP